MPSPDEPTGRAARPIPAWAWFVAWPLLLVGLVVVGRFAYDALAKRAFADHAEELEAIGETLDIEKLIPDPLPAPESNFAEAPIIRQLRGQSVSFPGEPPSWSDGREPDLDSIEGWERTTTGPRSVEFHRYRPVLADFPGLDAQQAYRAVRDYAVEFESAILALDEAARRPTSFIERDFSKGFAMDMPLISPVMDYSKFLAMRSRLALLNQDSAQAYRDTALVLRLASHLSTDSFLIDQLVANALIGMAATTLQEGLREDSWTEEQLGEFLEILAGIRLEQRLLQSIRWERALYCDAIINLSSAGGSMKGLLGEPYDTFSILIPNGWLYDNSRLFSELLQQTMLTGPDGRPARDRLPGGPTLAAEIARLESSRFSSAQYHLTLISLPSYEGVSERVLRTDTFLDHARIAIALELHRQDHGAYPRSLDAVASRFPVGLPLDRFTDAPYHYRVLEGGAYLLYGVGPNGVDEGGLMKRDRELGDWVWRLRQPEEFDFDEYERD